ncbi:MAG TPA: type III secretion protein [Deltaproteobacteria bacterium]|nr:type III secretion protein [Deltaproteobacteria bacterium]
MTVEIGLMPVLYALLGSIRVLVMMISGPIFSHPALSPRIRIIGSLMIAWVAAPVGVGALAGTDWDALTICMAVGTEVMIGLTVGIGSGLIFAAILQLGEFVAIQGGLGAARSLDPTSGASSVAIGMAFNTFAMVIFLVIGGHHELIRGIAASFAALPIGGGLPDPEAFLSVAKLGSVVWEVAFKLAAPITVAIFVQNVATGLLGRAMPQLNLLIANLPLHVGMLLLIVGLGAGDYVHAFKDIIEFWPSRVFGIVIGGIDGG